MPDPVEWGFKAIKPFDAEHPIGSGKMVHYDPGDEVPASDWGRAEGFMVEAGTIMRYVKNVLEVPGQTVSAPSAVQFPPVPTEAPAEPTMVEDDDEVEEDDAVESTDEAETDTVPFPQHEGGGWYLLSDGEKVQGKAAAIAAQAELEVSAETGGEETA